MDFNRLARSQYGVVTRAQAHQVFSDSAIRWRLQRGVWEPVHPGIYRVHTGELDWLGRASAALLLYGAGAALSLDSAAWLLGIDTRQPSIVHIDVPAANQRGPRPGVRVRRRRTLPTVRRRGLTVTAPAFTVLDLGDHPLASREDAIAFAAAAVQRRRATVAELSRELRRRRAHRHRHALELALGMVAEGAESVLEVAFVTAVLKAHRLPPMRMAVPDRAAGRSIRRDFVDDAHGIVIEVDGRIAHEDRRTADMRRDRSTAADGRITIRAGWDEVHYDACQLAFDIFRTAVSRGYRGRFVRCGPSCAVRDLRRAG